MMKSIKFRSMLGAIAVVILLMTPLFHSAQAEIHSQSDQLDKSGLRLNNQSPIDFQKLPPDGSLLSAIKGWLSIQWGDGSPDHPGTTGPFFHLLDNQGRYIVLDTESMHVPANRLLDLAGKQIEVRGNWLKTGDPGYSSGRTTFEVMDFNQNESIPADKMPESPAAAGNTPWISLLCKFSDIAYEPKPKSYFQDYYSSTFPGLDHYWREASYNAINLSGSGAAGWYSLPHPKSFYYLDNGDFNSDQAFTDCTNAADNDVNFKDYYGINLIFNADFFYASYGSCGYFYLEGESRPAGVTWMQPWSYGTQAVMVHEMGHGYCLGHSFVNEGTIPNLNVWDVMSFDRDNCAASHDTNYGCLAQHTIGMNKYNLGWLTASQVQTITSESSITLQLEQIAQPQSENIRLIKVLIEDMPNLFYTVEARRQVGYDIKLPGNAVIIHKVDTNNYRAAFVDVDGNDDTRDAGAMWTAGETFTDPSLPIAISVTAATATGFTVHVEVGKMPTFTNCDAQIDLPKLECEALVSLYNGTDGPNWLRHSGWLIRKPCNWEGVTCSGGHITVLELQNNHLKGELPSQLGNLSQVDTLIFSLNELGGVIPTTIKNLTTLRYLDLWSNHLSGGIPPELESLPNLVSLTLQSNKFMGEIPSFFLQLTQLKYFYIKYNSLWASNPGVSGLVSTLNPGWEKTQTVAPTNLKGTAKPLGALLNWDPVIYSEDGGYYEVSYAETEIGIFNVIGVTQDKTKTSYLINFLKPGKNYSFRVRTFTPLNANNNNNLWSEYSAVSNVTPVPGSLVFMPNLHR